MNRIRLDRKRKYILTAGKFFDAGSGFVKDTTIFINGNRTHKLFVGGKYSRHLFDLYDWEDAEIIDLKDHYVLPGLVDCHVHLALSGGRGKDSPENQGNHLHQLLKGGVLAVRDGGDRDCLTLGMVNNGGCSEGPVGPYIVATGCALRRKGMYGSFLGPGLKSKDDLAKMVAQMAAHAASQIKILASGLVSFCQYGAVGPMQFSPEDLSFIVREARGYGLHVMAHVNSAQGVKAAVLAGVRSVEHGYFLDGDCLDLMAERGSYWVPTIVPVANTAVKMKGYFTDRELTVIENTYRRQQEMVCRAVEKGVKVAIGTDSGAPGTEFGRSYIEELLLFQEAGVEVADIICAATVTGAKVLGLNGNENGFLAYKKDPLLDLANLDKPDFIIR